MHWFYDQTLKSYEILLHNGILQIKQVCFSEAVLIGIKIAAEQVNNLLTCMIFCNFMYFIISGKSLHVKRLREKLKENYQDKVHWNSSTIRFLEKNVDVDDAIETLTHAPAGKEKANNVPHFVHIDITPAVRALLLSFTYWPIDDGINSLPLML